MTARHHHYLSQCYLKGFTKNGAKKSKLAVIDLREKKVFETIPRNVGGIRDFNRIEAEGLAPDFLENSLSQFERVAASAIKHLLQTHKFEGDTKDTILTLVALLSVRSPQMRAHFAKFETDIMEKIMDLSLATKERWESQMDQMRRDGHGVDNSISYEDIKRFHSNKEYKFTIAREHHIGMELKMVDSIFPFLVSRSWMLICATAESGSFISTDNPVNLVWREPEKIPPFYRQSPGFGLKDTQVYFPVSKDLALVGEFDGPDGVYDANKNFVIALNSGLASRAYGQIYAPNLKFSMTGPDGNTITGDQLLKVLRA